MNKDRIKCYFEQLIFQKPLYLYDNMHLGHESDCGPRSSLVCSAFLEQDRKFIWNPWCVQQRSY